MMKYPSETLQNLPYFIYMGKPKIVFSILCDFIFFPNRPQTRALTVRVARGTAHSRTRSLTSASRGIRGARRPGGGGAAPPAQHHALPRTYTTHTPPSQILVSAASPVLSYAASR